MFCRSPLFGDTVPESALAPAAGAALSRPAHSTNRSGSQAGSAAELRAMRRKLDDMHAEDPEKQGGKNIVNGTNDPAIPLHTYFCRGLMEMVYTVLRVTGAFPDYDFTPVTYLIIVQTGDRLGAGTDSKVGSGLLIRLLQLLHSRDTTSERFWCCSRVCLSLRGVGVCGIARGARQLWEANARETRCNRRNISPCWA